jgi:Spy/CpxP family protein refolding chaperone
MKKLRWLLALVFCLIPVALLAQTNDQMQLIREAAKANKKLLVSKNMNLTEEKAKSFWPVYEEYQQALSQINERIVKAIKGYAENYKSLTDERAKGLLDESIAIEEDRLTLQKSYISKFSKVLQPKQVTRYYQIENKLFAIVRFDLARGIPLVK